MKKHLLIGALCALLALGFVGLPTTVEAATDDGVEVMRRGEGQGARDGSGPGFHQDGRGARDGRGRAEGGRGQGRGARDGSGPGHRQDAGGPGDGRGNGPQDGSGPNPNCRLK